MSYQRLVVRFRFSALVSGLGSVRSALLSPLVRIDQISPARARWNRVFLARKLSCAPEIVDPGPSNQRSPSGWPWGALSNGQHRMGGMDALFARRFLRGAGSGLVGGARLTCTLQKFIRALGVDSPGTRKLCQHSALTQQLV